MATDPIAPVTRARRKAAPDGGPGATAAVLWLMILLVFVPIVAMHLAAVWVNGGEGDPPAAAEAAK